MAVQAVRPCQACALVGTEVEVVVAREEEGPDAEGEERRERDEQTDPRIHGDQGTGPLAGREPMPAPEPREPPRTAL